MPLTSMRDNHGSYALVFPGVPSPPPPLLVAAHQRSVFLACPFQYLSQTILTCAHPSRFLPAFFPPSLSVRGVRPRPGGRPLQRRRHVAETAVDLEDVDGRRRFGAASASAAHCSARGRRPQGLVSKQRGGSFGVVSSTSAAFALEALRRFCVRAGCFFPFLQQSPPTCHFIFFPMHGPQRQEHEDTSWQD